jgi:serine O-acetyltransferase
MALLDLVQLIRADFKLHGARIQDPGAWALAAYRLGATSSDLPEGSWRRIATAATGGLSFALGLVTRTSIPAGVKVGKGFHLIHAMNVTIAAGVEIGDRVGVMHEVTIGPGYEGKGVPKIGNDVFIGVGAAVLGPITIGDGAMIAANSLVITDIPAGAFAVGVPAKVVRWGPTATGTPAGGTPVAGTPTTKGPQAAAPSGAPDATVTAITG